MTTVQKGDRVRLVYEGTVRRVGIGHVELCESFGDYSLTGAKSVDVLTRPAKVGDVVATIAALNSLPPSAVIVDERFAEASRRDCRRRFNQWWENGLSEPRAPEDVRLPVRVVWLPRVAA